MIFRTCYDEHEDKNEKCESEDLQKSSTSTKTQEAQGRSISDFQGRRVNFTGVDLLHVDSSECQEEIEEEDTERERTRLSKSRLKVKLRSS